MCPIHGYRQIQQNLENTNTVLFVTDRIMMYLGEKLMRNKNIYVKFELLIDSWTTHHDPLSL